MPTAPAAVSEAPSAEATNASAIAAVRDVPSAAAPSAAAPSAAAPSDASSAAAPAVGVCSATSLDALAARWEKPSSGLPPDPTGQAPLDATADVYSSRRLDSHRLSPDTQPSVTTHECSREGPSAVTSAENMSTSGNDFAATGGHASALPGEQQEGVDTLVGGPPQAGGPERTASAAAAAEAARRRAAAVVEVEDAGDSEAGHGGAVLADNIG